MAAGAFALFALGILVLFFGFVVVLRLIGYPGRFHSDPTWARMGFECARMLGIAVVLVLAGLGFAWIGSGGRG